MRRPQRESGVVQLESIEDDKWVETQLPACSVMAKTAEEISNNNAAGHDYKCIDSNHRIAALKRLDEGSGKEIIILFTCIRI